MSATATISNSSTVAAITASTASSAATRASGHRLASRSSSPRLVGASAPIRKLCDRIDALGRRQCTVLLRGESGTGKELAARLIHERSARASGPFVPVDCTTLRDALLESQLFGHTRGAFTGADRATLGFFRAAEGGTLFLDEIGELPLPSQAKLLRCIQEGVVVPLGATTGVPVNVRVIAATHRDLAEMVQRGEFRQDLYYRLNVACLRLPPLRERTEDIPLLVRHALDDLARLYGERPKRFTPAAMHVLATHTWPGNVRELINAVEHALVFSPVDSVDRVGDDDDNTTRDQLDVDDLPDEVRAGAARAEQLPNRRALVSGDVPIMTLEAAERQLIADALQACHGNQSRVARVLDIERHRLHRRIVHHGLTALVRK